MDKIATMTLEEIEQGICLPLEIYVKATMQGIIVKTGDRLRHVPVLVSPHCSITNKDSQGFVHPYDPFEFYPFSEYKISWWICDDLSI
jgi:hypothetical protein